MRHVKAQEWHRDGSMTGGEVVRRVRRRVVLALAQGVNRMLPEAIGSLETRSKDRDTDLIEAEVMLLSGEEVRELCRVLLYAEGLEKERPSSDTQRYRDLVATHARRLLRAIGGTVPEPLGSVVPAAFDDPRGELDLTDEERTLAQVKAPFEWLTLLEAAARARVMLDVMHPDEDPVAFEALKANLKTCQRNLEAHGFVSVNNPLPPEPEGGG